MANNILSNEAIDELVNLVSSGKYSKKDSGNSTVRESYEKIQRYNFKSPNRFTKDQLRTIRSIYDNFASALSSHLSGLLRKYCQIELVSVEEHTFSEFSSSLENPVMLGVVDLSPLQSSTLMEISHMMAYAIIGRLLGGQGLYSDSQRNYTEIEVALMDKLMNQFLDLMKESWARFHDVDPKMVRVETNSQFAQIVPLNETIAIITFSARIGDVEGIMNYCIPHMGTDVIFSNLKTKSIFFQSQVSNQESKAEEILRTIQHSSVELVSTFSETIVSAKDVMSIQVGDVLMLDNKTTEPIQIKVNKIPKFRGMIGTRKNKLSVRITEVTDGSIF